MKKPKNVRAVRGRLEFQALDQPVPGVDLVHSSSAYVATVTEYAFGGSEAGVLTRLVVHQRKGGNVSLAEAQDVKRAILGDVEAVVVLPRDGRTEALLVPGMTMLWCLSGREVFPWGPRGDLPQGEVPQMLRLLDVGPKDLVLLDEAPGEPDFVAGETPGFERARVTLQNWPVLDVQRARSGDEGWVEILVRADLASSRVQALPVALRDLRAPIPPEYLEPHTGRWGLLRDKSGPRTRILAGTVTIKRTEEPGAPPANAEEGSGPA